MVQTAGQLSASGKPSEALAMTVEARAAFQKFTNELDEVTTQLARVKGPGVYKQLEACGATEYRAALETDLTPLEQALRSP
ncbi:MAG: hypothetical protein ACXV3E_07545 [Halobacteriota archaeon]